ARDTSAGESWGVTWIAPIDTAPAAAPRIPSDTLTIVRDITNLRSVRILSNNDVERLDDSNAQHGAHRQLHIRSFSGRDGAAGADEDAHQRALDAANQAANHTTGGRAHANLADVLSHLGVEGLHNRRPQP